MISRKTTAVPLKSPVAPVAAVASDDQQVNEVGIDVGNAVMATPNSQSSQSSAGVVRIESTESLSSRRRNESEPLSKYSLDRSHGSHDHFAQQAAAIRSNMLMAAGKPPVKRSSSERYSSTGTLFVLYCLLLLLVAMTTVISSKHLLLYYCICDVKFLRSEFQSPRNSSSSGSGLISPTGVTLSLAGSHDNNSLSAGSRQSNINCCHRWVFLMIEFLTDYRPTDHYSNHTTHMFTSSTPIHREQFPSKSNVSY